MHTLSNRHHQQGAVIVTVALVMLFLLGFMGIALDFGHLFIVKTELQTAMDSCALAAAQELDGQNTALTRAASAGQTAGNLNKVNLQSSTWSGKGQITNADISFKDAFYVATTVAANAKYAQCQHTQSGIGMWLLQSMGSFSGNQADYPSTQSVMALAVATRAHAQTTCPIPVAFKPTAGSTAPNYGLTVGQWVPLIMAQNAAAGGEIGWANLDGSNSASETEAEMISACGIKVGDTLGTPGVKTSIADTWNFRFGLYKNTGDPAVNHPDFTGYAYTATNWPSQKSAYDGTPGSDPTGTAANFLNKRQSYASCADTGSTVNRCESITGLTLNSFQKLAAPGITTGGHKQYGASRRLVLVPVINPAAKVIDYVCMFMLQPLSIPMTTTQLEFRGNAGDPASPCTTSGLPGSNVGPLVPVLVH